MYSLTQRPTRLLVQTGSADIDELYLGGCKVSDSCFAVCYNDCECLLSDGVSSCLQTLLPPAHVNCSVDMVMSDAQVLGCPDVVGGNTTAVTPPTASISTTIDFDNDKISCEQMPDIFEKQMNCTMQSRVTAHNGDYADLSITAICDHNDDKNVRSASNCYCSVTVTDANGQSPSKCSCSVCPGGYGTNPFIVECESDYVVAECSSIDCTGSCNGSCKSACKLSGSDCPLPCSNATTETAVSAFPFTLTYSPVPASLPDVVMLEQLTIETASYIEEFHRDAYQATPVGFDRAETIFMNFVAPNQVNFESTFYFLPTSEAVGVPVKQELTNGLYALFSGPSILEYLSRLAGLPDTNVFRGTTTVQFVQTLPPLPPPPVGDNTTDTNVTKTMAPTDTPTMAPNATVVPPVNETETPKPSPTKAPLQEGNETSAPTLAPNTTMSPTLSQPISSPNETSAPTAYSSTLSPTTEDLSPGSNETYAPTLSPTSRVTLGPNETYAPTISFMSNETLGPNETYAPTLSPMSNETLGPNETYAPTPPLDDESLTEPPVATPVTPPTTPPSPTTDPQTHNFTGLSMRLTGMNALTTASRSAFETATEEFYKKGMESSAGSSSVQRRLQDIADFDTSVTVTGEQPDNTGNTIIYNQVLTFTTIGSNISESAARDALLNPLSSEDGKQEYLALLRGSSEEFEDVTSVDSPSLPESDRSVSPASDDDSDGSSSIVLIVAIVCSLCFCCCVCACVGMVFFRNKDGGGKNSGFDDGLGAIGGTDDTYGGGGDTYGGGGGGGNYDIYDAPGVTTNQEERGHDAFVDEAGVGRDDYRMSRAFEGGDFFGADDDDGHRDDGLEFGGSNHQEENLEFGNDMDESESTSGYSDEDDETSGLNSGSVSGSGSYSGSESGSGSGSESGSVSGDESGSEEPHSTGDAGEWGLA